MMVGYSEVEGVVRGRVSKAGWKIVGCSSSHVRQSSCHLAGVGTKSIAKRCNYSRSVSGQKCCFDTLTSHTGESMGSDKSKWQSRLPALRVNGPAGIGRLEVV